MSSQTVPELKQFKLVAWDNIDTLDELKLIVEAMVGELGFNVENPYYTILEKKGLLSDKIKEVAQGVPPAKPDA